MSELRAGLVIAGRYRLDAPLGEGGMSAVWRGTDLSLSREVAVKVLRADVAAQADSVARFRREAHAAAQLNHPNIVQTYDTGVDGALHFIVMEYLPEPDLKKIIHDWAPLPQQKVIDVGIQCCKALAHAHRHGIVHRDVKPHNILFSDDGRAKLSDFGIAAAVGGGATGPGGTVLGSAHYMAPEQVEGGPAGPHSDVYSLGCVLYEALTGRPPFEGATPAEIAGARLRQRPTPLRSLNPNVAPAVEFVINKAMAREVAQRYRTADEMLADLGKVSGGQVLDRTGVLAAPESATVALNPPRLTPAPEIRRPAAPPPSVPRPGDRAGVNAPVLRPPAEPQPSPWGPVLVGVIAVLALILVVWLAKLAFYSGESGKKVQVPMVKGLTLAEARDKLESSELKVGNITFQSDSTQPEGVVIAQKPLEGENAPTGTLVELAVNRGKELVVVVQTEGMSLSEASSTLQRAGLSVGEVTEIYHATIPAGRVIKQNMKPGTKTEKGSSVDLVVSKGPEPSTVTPPAENATGGPDDEASEPAVSVVRDENFEPKNPTQQRFIVTVTAQGKKSGQRIQVVKSDGQGGRKVVLEARMNPNQSQEVVVVTEGAATIEVLHEGRVVFKQPEPSPDQPSPAPDDTR